MTDRIDHAAEAQKVLAMPTSVWGSPSEMLAGAQVHASLALVEQLRIGNLIALGYGGDEADCDQARADARAALVNWHAHEDPEMGGWPEIRPDIAAALGIDHDEKDLRPYGPGGAQHAIQQAKEAS